MTKSELLKMLKRNNKENQEEIIKTITTKQFEDKKIAELFINKIIENGVFYQIYGRTNYSEKDNGDRFNEIYNIITKNKRDLKIRKFKALIKDMELTEKNFLIKMLNYEYKLNLLKNINEEKYLKLAQEVLEIALNLEYNENNYIKFCLFIDIIYNKQNWYLDKKLQNEEISEKIKKRKECFCQFLIKKMNYKIKFTI